MRYLSVCSGIEAVSVAWQPLGWQPAMFAEIDPFCCWLLRSRYGASRPVFMQSPHDAPDRKEAKRRAAAIRNIVALPADGDVINAGDFTKIGAEDVGAIDLLAGGIPCQAFSVAGKRAGLDDPRGNLTIPPRERRPVRGGPGIEFARLADRLRPVQGGEVSERAVPGSIENSSTTAVLQEQSVASPLTAFYDKQVDSSDASNGPPNLLHTQMAVRQLTPRECEGLQGFPDDYTLVEYHGKLATDGPRYKALGNSMVVPVMRWIGQRIAAVDAILRDGHGNEEAE